MPLYIPWLTETIKKRGVRYLLHHYLGQFFIEKLDLNQLSVDIYAGKGSIDNLLLDVNGLNDELDFIPFKFLDGCSIGLISVEVPWKSIATDACKVELEGAKFVCQLKSSSDSSRAHCSESTLLTRSLMTTSMQMAEEIVTTEDDEDYESPNASFYKQQNSSPISDRSGSSSSFTAAAGVSSRSKEIANQTFEGLEKFAQLIDSILRRTKLTAKDTLFRIRPCPSEKTSNKHSDSSDADSSEDITQSVRIDNDTDEEEVDNEQDGQDISRENDDNQNSSDGTVEFFIKYFRCEEIMDRGDTDRDSSNPHQSASNPSSEQRNNKSPQSCDMASNQSPNEPSLPGNVTKLLTLEDVEMRIGGVPVSNLVGTHTIKIEFNGQKSKISIFSKSPLLAVIGHEQLKIFFDVFDVSKNRDSQKSSQSDEKHQKVMSADDYAKIENQLLQAATRSSSQKHPSGNDNYSRSFESSGNFLSNPGIAGPGGRRWVESGNLCQGQRASMSEFNDYSKTCGYYHETDHDNHSHQFPSSSFNQSHLAAPDNPKEASLDHLEAFSCQLKLPGIWLCLLKSNETIPSLIKPYADSINSFKTINAYIDRYIKVPHIRMLALKVTLNLTSSGIDVFLGDLDVSEHLHHDSIHSTIHLLQNDSPEQTISSERYSLHIRNNKDITFDSLTDTRLTFDPTMIDRLVFDYKLFQLHSSDETKSAALNKTTRIGKQRLDVNLSIKSPRRLKIELLCPIPDLTPEAASKPTLIRPQSFIFDLRDVNLTFKSEKLQLNAQELIASVKNQSQQMDSEAVTFIHSYCKGSEKIQLNLEPSPSNLDSDFPNEINQALQESSMMDSIYVSQATESKIPTEAFQTKRKVVRGEHRTSSPSSKLDDSDKCDNEKILTPADRQHLLSYLDQTLIATKLSISLHLPACDVEFEDKEQLDLIYNRFGNDFVFWKPKTISVKLEDKLLVSDDKQPKFRQSNDMNDGRFECSTGNGESSGGSDHLDSENTFHSLSVDGMEANAYHENEVTCKVTCDRLTVKFNHQSCAAAMTQEIAAENLLFGLIVDVNKKPNTVISLVGDNFQLFTDSVSVLEGNKFCDRNSIFALTAEIKRPNAELKDIKLAIQLNNALFDDFETENFTRFWQSISVTDEPVLGYTAPKLITELHVNVLETALLIVKEGARPALLTIDELYLTSMVMEKTSQVMIRIVADEVSLYFRRNKGKSVPVPIESMKNYICLIDSGLIDLDVKFSTDGKVQFAVINNVITVRACHDSLSELFRLFRVLVKDGKQQAQANESEETDYNSDKDQLHIPGSRMTTRETLQSDYNVSELQKDMGGYQPFMFEVGQGKADTHRSRPNTNLLEDAMNELSTGSSGLSSSASSRASSCVYEDSEHCDLDASDPEHANNNSGTNYDGDEGEDIESDEDEDEEDDESYDGLPIIHRAISSESPRDSDDQLDAICPEPGQKGCLLDQSNPILGDLFPQPLVPSPNTTCEHIEIESSNEYHHDLPSIPDENLKLNQNESSLDESKFFVIGDDDVGTGIRADEHGQEPIIRKLIDEPINIVDNHFRMTTPKTIPEVLASSLGRYVLEEMSIVVVLYGGHDFDDTENDNECNTKDESQQQNHKNDDSSRATATNSTSSGNSKMNRQSNSVSSTKQRDSPEFSSLAESGGTKRLIGNRRKHLSESSKDAQAATSSSSTLRSQSGEGLRVRFGEGAVNLWESLDLMSAPDFFGSQKFHSTPMSADSKQQGGLWRKTDVAIQLTLNKIKLLYEIGDTQLGPIAWRFMLFIEEIEIKDRVQASDINKMLYEYCNESMPKRNAPMLTLKSVATINKTDGCEECDLKVSLKPLRLNIDQDTLLFLIEFLTTISQTMARDGKSSSATAEGSGSSAAEHPASFRPRSESSSQSKVSPLWQEQTSTTAEPTTNVSSPVSFPKRRFSTDSRDSRGANSSFKSCASSNSSCSTSTTAEKRSSSTDEIKPPATNSSSISRNGSGERVGSSRSKSPKKGERQKVAGSSTASRVRKIDSRSSSKNSARTLSAANEPGAAASSDSNHAGVAGRSEPPTCCHTDSASGSPNQGPTYIKSFIFSPDVPIRLDYHAKHMDFEQGALAGILMGLAHLDHSELVLKRVQAKHGMRGLDRVLLFALNHWLADIKRNQLHSLLGGVGPMHSIFQLFQGVRDLVWMPIEHYRRDRRLVRGLQRGAASFSSSTAMAAISLMNRFISIIQCTAQIAHDIVTPPNLKSHSQAALTKASSGDRKRPIGCQSKSGAAGSAGVPSSSLKRHHRIHYRAHDSNASGSGALGSTNSGSEPHGSSGGGLGAGTSLNQPRNFCEGLAVGFTILKEGINDTARNVAVGMQAEDMRSAVGELVRQIPSTFLSPIISVTEGAQNVLVGMRNQIAPDARREDQEKWKRRVRGK